jgi:serine/threonine protein kinase
VIALLSMSFESAPIFPGIFDGALVDGAEAYEQQAKLDGRGYRDTRGEEMIGAWTWLPEWEIGMGAEMDRTEVLRPVSRLRKTLAFLFGGVAGLTALLIAIGHRFGRAVAGNYALEGLIGRGGAAEVYRARHVHLERPAAVKVLMATDSESMARFGREARLVSRLSHPNTIQIYDYGRTGDGRFYFAMELVEGLTLSHVVTLGGPLPVARVVHLLDQICGSLEEAHAAGVLHHDIKPANVMLCRRGGRCDLVKVLDFGIAGSDEEARERSRVAGTPVYIAPERLCSSRTAGPRSDLYSLGALAFFLLTGRDVFEGETPSGILTQGLSADPPSPSLLRGAPIAEELETLVLDLLAKEPGRRPASAAEVRDRLASVVRSEPWSPEEALAWWTDRETRISRLVREKGER